MPALVVAVTPESAGWELLSAGVEELAAGEDRTVASPTHETAVVVIAGTIEIQVGRVVATITRDDVFTQAADVLYAPPGATIAITALTAAQIAIGQAPAVGLYPPRLITTAEMTGVLRGGGPARRQVLSVLADPLPAERLVVYEAWVPRGAWTGWPPHRHDGFAGSPRLEETYFYRFDRPAGFGFHRTWCPETGFEDVHFLRDAAMVPVRAGYHLCGNGPAANMWLLNFLAGPPADRARPPYVDPAEQWIEHDWSAGAMQLPVIDHGSRTDAHG